tara:strand:- start:1027 stop:1461 length:435 start_codon:yes stop_codon:yes gene_type:complete
MRVTRNQLRKIVRNVISESVVKTVPGTNLRVSQSSNDMRYVAQHIAPNFSSEINLPNQPILDQGSMEGSSGGPVGVHVQGKTYAVDGNQYSEILARISASGGSWDDYGIPWMVMDASYLEGDETSSAIPIGSGMYVVPSDWFAV